MKPTRNHTYCPDCGRKKMLFSSEEKAINFIKFNAQDIFEENGVAPTRAYFCIACCGWHITSNSEAQDKKSRSEIMLDAYEEAKVAKARATAVNKDAIDRFERLLDEMALYDADAYQAYRHKKFEECQEFVKRGLELWQEAYDIKTTSGRMRRLHGHLLEYEQALKHIFIKK